MPSSQNSLLKDDTQHFLSADEVLAEWAAQGWGSAFDVGEFGGDFAVADGEDVYATQVPGLAITDFVVDPTDDGAIAADDGFFRVETRIRIAGEPGAPKRDYIGASFDALAIRGRRSVLEDGVVSKKVGERIGIVTVESVIESVNDVAGGLLFGWMHGKLTRRREAGGVKR
jgi:hypothetical protein